MGNGDILHSTYKNLENHEEEHLEDGAAVHCQHADGSHHGAGHDLVYGIRTVLKK